MLHKTTQFFPSLQVPHLDDLVRAPGCQPLSSLRRNGNRFDARDMGREDEDGLEIEAVLSRVGGDCALSAIEQFFI